MKNKNRAFFFDKKFNMKTFEKKIKFQISYKQNFIEYSELGVNYLKDYLQNHKEKIMEEYLL